MIFNTDLSPIIPDYIQSFYRYHIPLGIYLSQPSNHIFDAILGCVDIYKSAGCTEASTWYYRLPCTPMIAWPPSHEVMIKMFSQPLHPWDCGAQLFPAKASRK